MAQELNQIQDSIEWSRVLEAFDFVPPGQVAPWSGNNARRGGEVLRFAGASSGAVAVQGRLTRSLGIERFTAMDGPLLGKACDEGTFVAFIAALRERLGAGCILSFLSILPHDAMYEIWLRKAGFRRPWCTVLSPLTLYVDCSESGRLEDGFRADWRKSIRKAEKNDLVFEVAPLADKRTREDLSDLYTETFRMKGITNYPAIPDFSAAGKSGPRWLVFFASHAGKRISGRLVLVSGEIAFDTAAGTNADGRRLSASHFLMASILKYLGQSGVRSFDFGRIGPGRFDSIDHFKYGAGGKPVAYLGEWILSSHPWAEFAFGAAQFLKGHERW